MKTLFVVLLVAFATSSLQAASDTLKVESLRTINVCSGEQRWLITASIGEVFFSDSFQLFDITIGYDTSRMTPTDGLSIGTLSDQMRALGGPTFNFRVPGEMRAAGFTINSNVAGDLPLFAIVGTYKGDCLYTDTLTLPWEPTFNEEFKGNVQFFQTDTMVRVANPIPDDSQGASIREDTTRIMGFDSTSVVTVVLHHSELQERSLTSILRLNDADSILIDEVISEDEITVRITENKSEATVDYESGTSDSLTLNIRLKSVAKDTLYVTNLTASLFDTTRCTCTEPVRTDSLTIESREPLTSINEDVHDSTVRLKRWSQNNVELQFSHGQLWNLRLVDMLGNTHMQQQLNGFEAQLDLTKIPTGVYFLHITDGSTSVVKKLLK